MRAPTSTLLHFPHSSYSSGMHHIHSPEHFLDAHGLCGPGFRLLKAEAPLVAGEYHVVSLTYGTLLGEMHARVFTNNSSLSEFLLMDSHRRPTLIGRLRLRVSDGGFTLRCTSTRLRDDDSVLWDIVRCMPPSAGRVEAAIRAGCNAPCEDANLRAYRLMVMGKRR